MIRISEGNLAKWFDEGNLSNLFLQSDQIHISHFVENLIMLF